MKPVDVLIVGAGSRGSAYAEFIARHPKMGRVTGVAEPREFHRDQIAAKHGIAPENISNDWRDAAARPRFADAVIIATQDAMHVEPAIAFARRGYHILLEKPLATSEAECRRLAEEVRKTDVMFAVCHVLRYTPYTQILKHLLDDHLVGDVVSIQHLEPVGYWHQAHSFVRGNWRNEKQSSPMLLAKSSHDLDWIRYIIGHPCRKVSSFGSLNHFRKEKAPPGAAARCLDCVHEAKCPYSAKRLYLGLLAKGRTDWPLNVIAPHPTEETVMGALRTGPYGRCVYDCDNDVVDNQVVNMLFEGGRTAAFTMTAFNEGGHRKTRIFGTRGALYGDGTYLEHIDFLTDKKNTIDTRASDATMLGGHGGGDDGLMHAFLDAVQTGDRRKILSGIEESLESHLMVFAAERARHENIVADVTT